ncbi:hypothetical protein Bbelb_143750 [Branchiostoma belcheri]|nr:hypothetical protein Bbelb_143750 [Branchiostoma belcheri]
MSNLIEIKHHSPVADMSNLLEIKHHSSVADMSNLLEIKHHSSVANMSNMLEIKHHSPVADMSNLLEIKHHSSVANMSNLLEIKHHSSFIFNQSLEQGQVPGDWRGAFVHPIFKKEPLEVCSHHPYLGITLSQDLKWSTHINTVTAKASSTLGFLKRNIRGASKQLQTPGGTLWRPRTRVQRRPRMETSPRTQACQRPGTADFPPRAERECDPAVALLQPLPPDRASRHPEDSDSSLGIQFRVVGTGHPAGSPGTERRGGVGRLSKRETVGQFRVSEVVGTVGQSQNLVCKTVRRFYGISFCRCLEVGQSRSEKLKVSVRFQQW